MNRFFTAIIFCFAFFQSTGQNQVTVQVENFKNNEGVCQACIFQNASAFEQMKAMQCITALIKDKRSLLIFSGVPNGSYAIFVFHDRNNNQKMDKNFLGIPKEGYGASSNKLPFASAPKFSENKFYLSNQASLKLNIRLRNM